MFLFRNAKQDFRRCGLATKLKHFAFTESRKMFPEAKLFGLTTSSAVMTINSELGYRPVTYSELTSDGEFWKGCQSCVNFKTLMEKDRKNCFCTAMLFDPKKESRIKKYVENTSDSVTSKPQLYAMQQSEVKSATFDFGIDS